MIIVFRYVCCSDTMCVSENSVITVYVQILKGSHKAGRVDHIRVGEQVGADPERVELLGNILELVYLELEPGDAAFFHSNLLHRSDQNSSPRRRYGYLVCFNRADNDPVYVHHHPKYTPLIKVNMKNDRSGVNF